MTPPPPTAKPRARKPKVPKPLERDIQKTCVGLMRLGGWRPERRNTGAMSWVDRKGKDRLFAFGSNGAADLFGSIPRLGSRHFECEVKRRGERPTYDQVRFLIDAHRSGCVSFWVDSGDHCEKVIDHVNVGGSIRYLDTTRKYPVTNKAGKKIGEIEGPSGDYELVNL